MDNKQFAAVLVDLDGTLFDTVTVNAASYRHALEEVGFTVTDEYYAKCCNGGALQEFSAPAHGQGDPDPALLERVHDRKKELYSACLGAAGKTRPFLPCWPPCGPPPGWAW